MLIESVRTVSIVNLDIDPIANQSSMTSSAIFNSCYFPCVTVTVMPAMLMRPTCDEPDVFSSM